MRSIDSRYTREIAEALPGAAVDARVVWSSDDRLFPLAHAERLAAMLRAGPVHVVEDAAAFIPEDRPLALAEIIGGFAGG